MLTSAHQPLLDALMALHALYEDFKLDTLSWRHLPRLGACLAAVAGRLGLAAYWEHYARDLGPGALLAEGAYEPRQEALVEGGVVLRPPADIYR